MKKLMPVLAFVCFISWVVVVAAETQNEGLEVKIGPEWKTAFSPNTRKSTDLEFIREGDNINNWKEIVTIRNLGPKPSSKSTPEEIMDAMKRVMEIMCPGATEWNVIEKNKSSILFERHAGVCRGQPEVCAIERIIVGTHDFFSLRYTARVHELTPDTRAQWIKTCSEATVDSKAGALVPLAESENVDEVIPFESDKVMAALKPAMESADCHVTEATANRIECKRPRNYPYSGHREGGESVTAVLDAQGDQTRVRISTGKGIYGRFVKENWSTRVYRDMVKNLQQAPP